MRRIWHAVPVLLAAGALGGCGISDPYNDARGAPPSTSTTVTYGATTPTGPPTDPATIDQGIGSSVPERVDPADLSRSRAEAIERYSDLVGTWAWNTIVERFRAAARISLGSARRRVLASARQVPSIAAYRAREVRQRTRIEAIVARGPGREGPSYLVVLRRRIELNDSPPSDQWSNALVTLRRIGDRWLVASWEDLI